MSPICDAAPGHAAGETLRTDVLRFLAGHARPGAWTWFAAAPPSPGFAVPADRPDIVIEVGGRVVYVEIRAPHLGPLPRSRRAWLAAARCRGAATATVRSVPDIERLLAGLGVRLRRPGRLGRELAAGRTDRREKDGEIETGTDPEIAARGRAAAGAADAVDGRPAAA